MRTKLAIGIWLAIAASAATQTDRRDRHDPELVIESGGRTGTCDALLFDRKGEHLFAVGDDKVVRIWYCGKSGLETAHMRTVRWPAWREQRGGIKALAISRDGKRIVVGGYGVLVKSIAVIDWEEGEAGRIVAMHPREPEKVTDFANYSTVMNAEFSDDGKSIAYGTADGSVWLWEPYADPARAPRRLVKHESMIDYGTNTPSGFNRPRLIAFLNSGNVLSVAQSGEVFSLDPTGENKPMRRKLINLEKKDVEYRYQEEYLRERSSYPDGVYRAALNHDRSWVAIGVNGPLAACFSLAEPWVPAKYVELGKREFVRAIAFARDSSRLAISIGSVPAAADFSIEANDRVALIDDPLKKNWKLSDGPPHAFRADALAFHTDGRLAVAGGDNHEVTLWNLANPKSPQSVARGAGRNLWGVRISTDGKAIGFQAQRNQKTLDPNKRGNGPLHAFSLVNGTPVDGKVDWFEPLPSYQGWTIEPDSKNRFVWYVTNPSLGVREPLPIDRHSDEAPRCWSFLPAAKDKPLLLVVGHFYGCSVYQIADKKVTRQYFCVGHAGEVMAIAPSADGTWFITASTDQTVGAWRTDEIPGDQLFGARLLVEDGQVMVREVAPRSPAYEMGLVKGDQIVFMAVAGAVRFNHSDRHDGPYGPKKGDPRECAKYLAQPVVGDSIHLGIRRAGKTKMIETETTMPRRPVWRLFPAFDENENWRDYLAWLWWRPYYLSSINGDSLAGWTMNSASMIETPRFYKAVQLREKLEDKKLLLEVLLTRKLDAALAGKSELQFDEIEPAPVQIEASSQTVGEKGITARLSVRKRNNNPDLLPQRVDLWVGDFLVEFWEPNEREFAREVALPLNVFRNGPNRIVLRTKNRNGLDNEAEVIVEANRPISAPKMHGVFIGVNCYDPEIKRTDKGGVLETLQYAMTDAKALSERWKEHQGKGRLFAPGNQRTFFDKEVNAAAILDHLESLTKDTSIQADDLMILFFAGHGLDLELPGSTKDRKISQFVFCCPDFIANQHTTTGIAGDALVKKLSLIRCRKLLIFDACKSGLAAASDLAREMAVAGQNFVIMTACGSSQLATENKQLGHGLFTAALLEALDPKCTEADANNDQVLDANELFDFVKKRVRVLVEKTNSRTMTPMCYPSPPDRFPVARREAKKN